MKLILITPDDTFGRELSIVNGCFAYGLQRLHLRKKGFSKEDYRNYIAAVDDTFHDRIVLTEYFSLLEEFNLGGVHLNSHIRDLQKTSDELALLKPKQISSSFHSWDEIAAAKDHFNYVFISPVFDSISKKGYKAGIDLEGAATLKQTKVDCPEVIGLGGVQAYNIQRLKEMNFDGAALLGAVWESENPVVAFREIYLRTQG
ncbi:thiamine phosphate synthase [Taibaiella soli]|uniref:Thiamine phosphate synthase n=1 Tax=Taibaiella soli TaxID=1649169 RepID=A0A2W2AGX9_9BACT|nr:thiamine phosphate synthase [Taibaiella soli]PZF71470.1 thiamine phosphate synthase [Taibaiella soli]